MQNKDSLGRYLMGATVGATVGAVAGAFLGLLLVLADRLLSLVMPRMMAFMIPKMMEYMEEGDVEPPCAQVIKGLMQEQTQKED